MMTALFSHLSDPTLWLLIGAAALAAGSSAMIGTFIILEKRSLMGDAVSHAALPGICIAFMLTGEKKPWILLLGCMLSGGLALYLLDYLPRRGKIKRENAIALVLATFLGVGLLLLSRIQHSGNASQVGLEYMLLGSMSGIMQQDMRFFAWLNLILFSVIILLFREWEVYFFDQQFARTIGRPITLLRLLFYSLSLLAIVIGVQAVGIILLSVMLIAPPMGARFWSQNLKTVVVLSTLLGMFASTLGMLTSYLFPSLPAGACIVLWMNGLAFLSFAIAPKQGWIIKRYRQYGYQKKVREENLLKLLYETDSESKKGKGFYTQEQISLLSKKRIKYVAKTLRSLCQQGFVQVNSAGEWGFTGRGYEKGKGINRLHLLWEGYLEKYLGIQQDHVHDDAESVEHLINPELEAELMNLVKLKG